MGFHLFLAFVVVGAVVQVLRLPARTSEGVGETVLVWVLVGYCGLPMIVFMTLGLVHPHELAEMAGFEPGSPFQTFSTWALLGMGLSATLAFRYRGAYLVGPALAWAVFFLGATGIHISQYGGLGSMSHTALLTIVATHGLISILLLGALGASGAWKRA